MHGFSSDQRCRSCPYSRGEYWSVAECLATSQPRVAQYLTCYWPRPSIVPTVLSVGLLHAGRAEQEARTHYGTKARVVCPPSTHERCNGGHLRSSFLTPIFVSYTVSVPYTTSCLSVSPVTHAFTGTHMQDKWEVEGPPKRGGPS